MPPRAAWKGSLQIRQLEIPVKAFTACGTQAEIPLNQLHRGCGARIQQQKVCPIHGVLTSDEIMSGYAIAEGRYLPLNDHDLEALLPDDPKAIQVDAFVGSRYVDPVYHAGRTYYVVPDGPPGQRPFGVLREGLRAADKHGVARVVMARRELLVLVRPLGRLIAMTVLEYPQRVRSHLDLEGEIAGLTVGAAEQALIRQLIDSLTEETLDLTRYHDRYTGGLNALIERELAGTTPLATANTGEPDEAALVAALRASLAAAGVNDLPTPLPSRTQRTSSADEDTSDPLRKPA
jgi:DNA end-binding protein Ku